MDGNDVRYLFIGSALATGMGFAIAAVVTLCAH